MAAHTTTVTSLHRDSRGQGILLCVLAMMLFSGGNAFVKVALHTFSVPQTMMLRLWALMALSVVIAIRRGGLRTALMARRPLLQFARGGFLVTDQLMFTLTLVFLGLVETSALYATTPLIAMALAFPLLGERIGWRHWLAVSVGLAGALMIVRPGTGVFQPAAVLALFGALMYALYALSTRLASRTDSHETSLLYTSLAGVIVMTPFGVWHWEPGDAVAWAFLLAALGFSLVAHVFAIKAYALAPASVLQPFNYVGLAASTLLGIVFFGERPDHIALAGTAAIAIAGLAIAWHESRTGR